MLKKTKMTKKILAAAVLTGLLTGGFMGTGYADPPVIDLVGVDENGYIQLKLENGTVRSSTTAAEIVVAGIEDAIDIVGASPITVTSTTANNKITYEVGVTEGTIAANEKGLVTGGTVFNEVRVSADGNYILKDNTASQNLVALDEAVKDLNDNLDNKANTSLDNITEAGKTVVRNLAQEAVKVIDGTYTTVNEGTDGNAKTYAVNVTVDGRIEQGNTGMLRQDYN